MALITDGIIFPVYVDSITINKMQPQSRLEKLKEKMKKAAGLKGLITEIPVPRFSCPNHGKEKTFHCFDKDPFSGKIEDIVCDCGSIFVYRPR